MVKICDWVATFPARMAVEYLWLSMGLMLAVAGRMMTSLACLSCSLILAVDRVCQMLVGLWITACMVDGMTTSKVSGILCSSILNGKSLKSKGISRENPPN